MSQTPPITSIIREARDDRRAVRLPTAWIRERPTPTPPPTRGPLRAITDAPLPLDGEAPAIVLLGPHPPPRLLAAVTALASAERRTYVLFDRRAQPAVDALDLHKRAPVLLRRAPTLPLDGLVRGRGEPSGVALPHPRAEASRWWLALDAPQGAALYAWALHWFWETADGERWPGRDRRDRLHPPIAAPFDADPPVGGPLRASAPPKTLLERLIWHAPDGRLPPPPSAGVVVPPSGHDHEALAVHDAEIAWVDLELPAFAADDKGGCLRWRSDGTPWHLALTPAQGDALAELTTEAFHHFAWRFAVDSVLGEQRGELWLPDAKAPAEVEAHVERDLGVVTADRLRSMQQTEAERPPPPPLAQQITWRWTVEPPRLPKGASVDPLVTAWQGLDAAFEEQRARLGGHLDAVAERAQGFKARFEGFARALLGLDRSRNATRDALATLRPPTTHGTPDAAREVLDTLTAITAQVDAHVTRSREAEYEARCAHAEHEQRTAFERARTEAQAREATATRARDEATARRAELADEHAALEAEGPPPDEAAPPPVKGGKKGKKPKRAPSAYATRLASLTDELSALDRTIERAEADRAAAREAHAAPFVFAPPPRPGAQGLDGRPRGSSKKKGAKGPRYAPTVEPAAWSAPPVPSEALPTVGALMRKRTQRYLVIERWGELDAGEADAERLDALLVAPRGPEKS